MFYLIGSFPVSGHYSKCKFHHYILVAPMPTSQPSPLGALLSSHPAMAQHDNYSTQPADIRTQPGRTENSPVFSLPSFPSCFPCQVIAIYRPSTASITGALFTLWFRRNIARRWPWDMKQIFSFFV